MSYTNAKYIKPKNTFRGGMIDNLSDFLLDDKDSPYLKNVRISGQGSEIRKGHVQFGNTLTNGTYPKGIASYLRAVVTNDRIIVNHNADLISIDSAGAQTPISTALITSDTRMNFTNIGDSLYCMNGVDLYGKLANVTYSNPATGVASLSPKFGAYFNGSHFVSGWSTNPNKVYQSANGNPDDFAGSGSDDYSFPESVVGLVATKIALLYFTKNSIHVTGDNDIVNTSGVYTYSNRPLSAQDGASNHESIVTAGNQVYFLSSSNRIKKVVLNQGGVFEVAELSHRENKGIATLMSTLATDQSDSFGYFIPDQNIVKWFLKSKGASFNDVCAVYDIDYDLWLRDTQKPFFGGIYWKGQAYTISGIEKKIFKDEAFQVDDDTAIPFEYDTKNYSFGETTRLKELWQIRNFLQMNELAVVTIQTYVDGALINTTTLTGTTLSEVVAGIATAPIGIQVIGGTGVDDDYFDVTSIIDKSYLQVKGKKIQLKYKCNSLAGKVRLSDLDLRLALITERAN